MYFAHHIHREMCTASKKIKNIYNDDDPTVISLYLNWYYAPIFLKSSLQSNVKQMHILCNCIFYALKISKQ